MTSSVNLIPSMMKIQLYKGEEEELQVVGIVIELSNDWKSLTKFESFNKF